MFIPIKVDLTDLIQEFDLDASQIKDLASNLTNEITQNFYAALQQKVNSTLKSARNIYLQNLRMDTVDDYTKEIILTGWLSNAIESGASSFDMKEGFSKSAKKKFNKNGGWYLVIPFQFSAPNASGETGQNMPKEIYNIVKKQKTPLRKNQIPQSVRMQELQNLMQRGTYQHKGSIYEGMKKNKDGTFNTFRTVGENSDIKAFVHPGFTPKNLFEQAQNDIETEIPVLANRVIDQFLEDFGFENN